MADDVACFCPGSGSYSYSCFCSFLYSSLFRCSGRRPRGVLHHHADLNGGDCGFGLLGDNIEGKGNEGRFLSGLDKIC